MRPTRKNEKIVPREKFEAKAIEGRRSLDWRIVTPNAHKPAEESSSNNAGGDKDFGGAAIVASALMKRGRCKKKLLMTIRKATYPSAKAETDRTGFRSDQVKLLTFKHIFPKLANNLNQFTSLLWNGFCPEISPTR
jgi:hypothetical protein